MSAEDETDPGGHTPPPPYSDAAIETLVARLTEAMSEAVGKELAKIREEMALHQKEELGHHKRVDASLKILVKGFRSHNKQLAELTARVAELEGDRESA